MGFGTTSVESWAASQIEPSVGRTIFRSLSFDVDFACVCVPFNSRFPPSLLDFPSLRNAKAETQFNRVRKLSCPAVLQLLTVACKPITLSLARDCRRPPLEVRKERAQTSVTQGKNECKMCLRSVIANVVFQDAQIDGNRSPGPPKTSRVPLTSSNLTAFTVAMSGPQSPPQTQT